MSQWGGFISPQLSLSFSLSLTLCHTENSLRRETNQENSHSEEIDLNQASVWEPDMNSPSWTTALLRLVPHSRMIQKNVSSLLRYSLLLSSLSRKTTLYWFRLVCSILDLYYTAEIKILVSWNILNRGTICLFFVWQDISSYQAFFFYVRAFHLL